MYLIKDLEEKLEFDKDDAIHVEIVKILCNFRCMVYGIELQTVDSIRSTVGKIVPAISSSNSLISGLLFSNLRKYFIRHDIEKFKKKILERFEKIKIQKNKEMIEQKDINQSKKTEAKQNSNILQERLKFAEEIYRQALKTKDFTITMDPIQRIININMISRNKKCRVCSLTHMRLTLKPFVSFERFKEIMDVIMDKAEEYSVYTGSHQFFEKPDFEYESETEITEESENEQISTHKNIDSNGISSQKKINMEKKRETQNFLSLFKKIKQQEEGPEKIYKLKVLNDKSKICLVILLEFKNFNDEKDFKPVLLDLSKEKFEFSKQDREMSHTRNNRKMQIGDKNIKEKLEGKVIMDIFTEDEEEMETKDDIQIISNQKKIQTLHRNTQNENIKINNKENGIQSKENIELTKKREFFEFQTKKCRIIQIVYSKDKSNNLLISSIFS